MAQEITSVEEAARVVEPIFRERGWRYGFEREAPDAARLEETIRYLLFHPAFQGDEPSAFVETGRFLVTATEDNSRSLYLHLFDL